ncbi:hypothetical protein DUNSADRAFT_16557 [Dunaliella salina]|uniref:Protein FAM136A n=1 Tax=Dunaliella salina TaxID=3046 RepID=A0ABQ7H0U8_DUNSA|nr:hypothetical protein DUNSADRAFT_16557 [Dunaliella salina]|eukprot:KAF5840466.1 hypothetical protein DUNSADRAFT_16557 [Dunaliella salina]
MQQPQSIRNVQNAVDSMMASLSRTHLIPAQKEAFLCCAGCCDPNARPEQLQSCVEHCSNKSMQQQKVIQGVMSDFQERFQRCAMRCQDTARETAGLDPSPADEKRAKDAFGSCVDACGQEFEGKMPKLHQEIEKQLQRL